MLRLTLIPALLIIIYSVYRQIRVKRLPETILITLGGFIAVFNTVIVYDFSDTSQPPAYLLCIQQILSSMIVPIAYMYFARQTGRDWFNPTTAKLWMMVFLLLVPSGYYFLDYMVPDIQGSNLMPMSIHLFLHGEEIYVTHIADIVIACQALITLARMFSMRQTYRRYHIKPSRNIRWFVYWWATCIAFIIISSACPHDYFIQPAILCCYYVLYSFLVVFIFVLISLNLDLRPAIKRVDIDDSLEYTNEDDAAIEYKSEGESKIESESEVEAEHRSDDEEKNANDDIEEVKTTEALTEVVLIDATEVKSDDIIIEVDEPEYESIEKIDTFLFQSQVIADRVRTILNDKNRCLDINLTTESMISELGTNRTYFYRIMKAEFGCTFNDILLKVRMKYATSMLTSTNAPVHEIAIRCGFSDNNSFSRRFKQVYGMTPSKYREENGF